jgi:hypothetical protein
MGNQFWGEIHGVLSNPIAVIISLILPNSGGILVPENLIGFKGNDVNPAKWHVALEVLLGQKGQPPLGAQNEFFLFGRRDACCGSAKVCAVPRPDFDKNEDVLVLHDEIDFTKGAAQLSAQELAASLPQEGQCLIFEFISLALQDGTLGRRDGLLSRKGGRGGRVQVAACALALPLTGTPLGKAREGKQSRVESR